VLFLAEKGIITEHALPYHHSQNGVIKQYNRTIADMGRSVLYGSALGKDFCRYTFMWFSWTLNCIPNRVTKTKTPYK
jgi:hypothetical protein